MVSLEDGDWEQEEHSTEIMNGKSAMDEKVSLVKKSAAE